MADFFNSLPGSSLYNGKPAGEIYIIVAVTDPIADFLTRIRNAQMAGHRVVDIPASSLKKRITEILYDQGYYYAGENYRPIAYADILNRDQTKYVFDDKAANFTPEGSEYIVVMERK